MSDPIAALQQTEQRAAWLTELGTVDPGSPRAQQLEAAREHSYRLEHGQPPAEVIDTEEARVAAATAVVVPPGLAPGVEDAVRAVVMQDGLQASAAQELLASLRTARPGGTAEAGHAELVRRLGSVAAADAALAKANARLQRGLPVALDQLARGDYACSPEVVLALARLYR